MNLRTSGSSGLALGSDNVSAAGYAAAHGAKVVNMSFASYAFDQGMHDMIAAHPEMLFVPAAANDALNMETQPAAYPCSFRDVQCNLCGGDHFKRRAHIVLELRGDEGGSGRARRQCLRGLGWIGRRLWFIEGVLHLPLRT